MEAVKIGIQGDLGSATESGADVLCQRQGFQDIQFVYLISASGVIDAVVNSQVDYGVLAFESPIGVPVHETAEALRGRRNLEVVDEVDMEVNHVLLGRVKLEPDEYTRIISHPTPLAKHAEYLHQKFPNGELVEIEDTGLAARNLRVGLYDDDTLVIAMPSAERHFKLQVIDKDLPANRGYLTRFQMIRGRG